MIKTMYKQLRALSLAALLTAGHLGCSKTQAEQFYDHFPTLSRAEVKKEREKNIQQIIVHLKEVHLVPESSFKPKSRNCLKFVGIVQDDVYHLMRELARTRNLREMYLDGLQEGQDLGAYIKSLRDPRQIAARRRYSAPARAILNNLGITFLPGENDRIFQQTLLDLGSVEGLEETKRVLEEVIQKREDYLLEHLIGDNPVIFVLYGIRHDLGDNIQLWNERYPHQQRALIEVTPISIEKQRGMCPELFY